MTSADAKFNEAQRRHAQAQTFRVQMAAIVLGNVLTELPEVGDLASASIEAMRALQLIDCLINVASDARPYREQVAALDLPELRPAIDDSDIASHAEKFADEVKPDLREAWNNEQIGVGLYRAFVAGANYHKLGKPLG